MTNLPRAVPQQADSYIKSCTRRERDLSHLRPPPRGGPPLGPGFSGQSMPHSGKLALGEALISPPHLHSHSNRKWDAHCLIHRGCAWPGWIRAQLDDPAWVAHPSPFPPWLAKAPAGDQTDGWIGTPGCLSVRRFQARPAACPWKEGGGAANSDSWVLHWCQGAICSL